MKAVTEMPTVRMSYRNQRHAMCAWAASVRDAAVLTLAKNGGPMPISILAAAIGVDVGGLFHLLDGDRPKRFIMLLGSVQRGDRGTKTARLVALSFQADHRPAVVRNGRAV